MAGAVDLQGACTHDDLICPHCCTAGGGAGNIYMGRIQSQHSIGGQSDGIGGGYFHMDLNIFQCQALLTFDAIEGSIYINPTIPLHGQVAINLNGTVKSIGSDDLNLKITVTVNAIIHAIKIAEIVELQLAVVVISIAVCRLGGGQSISTAGQIGAVQHLDITNHYFSALEMDIVVVAQLLCIEFFAIIHISGHRGLGSTHGANRKGILFTAVDSQRFPGIGAVCGVNSQLAAGHSEFTGGNAAETTRKVRNTAGYKSLAAYRSATLGIGISRNCAAGNDQVALGDPESLLTGGADQQGTVNHHQGIDAVDGRFIIRSQIQRSITIKFRLSFHIDCRMVTDNKTTATQQGDIQTAGTLNSTNGGAVELIVIQGQRLVLIVGITPGGFGSCHRGAAAGKIISILEHHATNLEHDGTDINITVLLQSIHIQHHRLGASAGSRSRCAVAGSTVVAVSAGAGQVQRHAAAGGLGQQGGRTGVQAHCVDAVHAAGDCYRSAIDENLAVFTVDTGAIGGRNGQRTSVRNHAITCIHTISLSGDLHCSTVEIEGGQSTNAFFCINNQLTAGTGHHLCSVDTVSGLAFRTDRSGGDQHLIITGDASGRGGLCSDIGSDRQCVFGMDCSIGFGVRRQASVAGDRKRTVVKDAIVITGQRVGANQCQRQVTERANRCGAGGIAGIIVQCQSACIVICIAAAGLRGGGLQTAVPQIFAAADLNIIDINVVTDKDRIILCKHFRDEPIIQKQCLAVFRSGCRQAGADCKLINRNLQRTVFAVAGGIGRSDFYIATGNRQTACVQSVRITDAFMVARGNRSGALDTTADAAGGRDVSSTGIEL